MTIKEYKALLMQKGQALSLTTSLLLAFAASFGQLGYLGSKRKSVVAVSSEEQNFEPLHMEFVC